MKRLVLALCLAAAAAFGASAQAVDIVVDEDALFGDMDEMVEGETAEAAKTGETAAPGTTAVATGIVDENALFGDDSVETVKSGSATAAVNSFLKSDAAKIGGNFSGSLGADWTWTDPWNGNRDIAKPDAESLPAAVSALVYFSARPDEDSKIYGSVKTSWPFSTSSGSATLPNISVFELFSDFSWNDTVYFRFGKHTVKWGVGYFWSPADVINLQGIDVQDPTAQREGPISFRALYPIPNTQNNLWAYVLVPTVSETSKLDPLDIGLAGKAEFLLGDWELGLGAFYQRDKAPKAMLTATGAIGQVSLFGEAVAAWGSDKNWVASVTAIPPFVKTEQRDDRAYFAGTAGFSWSKSDWDLSVAGQYYYSADGYADSDRRSLITDARAIEANPFLPSAVKDNFAMLLKGVIISSGQHYAGLSVTRTELGLKDLSLSLLAIANLSDLSGFVKPTLSYRFFNKLSASAGANFYWATDELWGDGKNAEYVVLAGGPSVTVSLSASLGGGRF